MRKIGDKGGIGVGSVLIVEDCERVLSIDRGLGRRVYSI